MTLEDQITALLAQAEPLRGLEEDDPAKHALGKIIDRINALRAKQAQEPQQDAAGLWFAAEQKQLQAKRRGRPRLEGADA